MALRKINHVFTFEEEHTLPYANSPEPEKDLSLYQKITLSCSNVYEYTQKLIRGWFVKEESIVQDDLEKGVRIAVKSTVIGNATSEAEV